MAASVRHARFQAPLHGIEPILGVGRRLIGNAIDGAKRAVIQYYQFSKIYTDKQCFASLVHTTVPRSVRILSLSGFPPLKA